MRNFHNTFQTRMRSIISAFSIYMTLPLSYFTFGKLSEIIFTSDFFLKKTSELMELAVVIVVIPRLTFTCSNSTIEKGVKYVQR